MLSSKSPQSIKKPQTAHSPKPKPKSKKEGKEISSPPLEKISVCGRIRLLDGNVAQSVEQLTFNP